jgi:EAL domain-containing protein (putative c-di-GMP-specific phosphodiesterase class I)
MRGVTYIVPANVFSFGSCCFIHPEVYVMSSVSSRFIGAINIPPFAIAYQPIVNVPARRVAAYEALVRGPQGISYPELVAGMDRRTLRFFHHKAAEETISRAVALGLAERKASLTINILPDRDPAALNAQSIRELAQFYGLPVNRIILEMTEDHHLSLAELTELLGENRAAGFASAMDDFGAGYSGLTALVDCRPDVLKLDRALIRDIDHSAAREKIVGAFVKVCHALGMTLVAEGVETLAECRKLRTLGIKYMQGFFFSRPVVNALPRFEHCVGIHSLEPFRGRKKVEDSGLYVQPWPAADVFTLQAKTA